MSRGTVFFIQHPNIQHSKASHSGRYRPTRPRAAGTSVVRVCEYCRCNTPVYCEVVRALAHALLGRPRALAHAFPSSAPSAVLFLFGGTLPLETLPLRGQMAEQKAEKEGEVAEEPIMSLSSDDSTSDIVASSPGGGAAQTLTQRPTAKDWPTSRRQRASAAPSSSRCSFGAAASRPRPSRLRFPHWATTGRPSPPRRARARAGVGPASAAPPRAAPTPRRACARSSRSATTPTWRIAA